MQQKEFAEAANVQEVVLTRAIRHNQNPNEQNITRILEAMKVPKQEKLKIWEEWKKAQTEVDHKRKTLGKSHKIAAAVQKLSKFYTCSVQFHFTPERRVTRKYPSTPQPAPRGKTAYHQKLRYPTDDKEELRDWLNQIEEKIDEVMVASTTLTINPQKEGLPKYHCTFLTEQHGGKFKKEGPFFEVQIGKKWESDVKRIILSARQLRSIIRGFYSADLCFLAFDYVQTWEKTLDFEDGDPYTISISLEQLAELSELFLFEIYPLLAEQKFDQKRREKVLHDAQKLLKDFEAGHFRDETAKLHATTLKKISR